MRNRVSLVDVFSRVVSGTVDEQRQAWREARRAKDAQGIKDRWPEIPSEHLLFTRRWVEDTRNGNLYQVFGGDPGYASSVIAHYLRPDGSPVMSIHWKAKNHG